MTELLKQLKETLTSVISELERQEAVPLNQDVLIISKEDFKYLKYETFERSDRIFSFKQDVMFVFWTSNQYHNQLYQALMQNKLERIILQKRKTPPVNYGNGKYLVNYRIEDEENTKLRELYLEGVTP